MSTSTVQSLDRGLMLIERLAEARDGVSLAELARSVGLKAPTAHNLLGTLVARGFAEKLDAPRRYRLGPSAGRLQPPPTTFPQRVSDTLTQLYADHRSFRLSYSELRSGDIVQTHRLSPENRGRPVTTLGPAMGPYTTASALLHQALWPHEQRAAYRLTNPFEVYGNHVWKNLKTLDAYLNTVRDDRRCAPVFRMDAHLRVAAPVTAPGGALRGTLGLYLPAVERGGLDEARAVEHLTHAAVELSTS